MIADMLSNKKINAIVTELIIRARRFDTYLSFSNNLFQLCQKILDQFLHNILFRKFQIKKSFSKLHLIIYNILTSKICIDKPCSFLVIDATLTSDNPLRFRKNLLERT